MKKFLLKFSLLSFAVVCLSFISNFLFINSYSYNNLLVERGVTKFFDVPSDLQIINFGTSHETASFNYENYNSYNTFNFALGGQYLAYDKILLESYLDNIQEDAIAIILISHHVLYREEIDNINFASQNKRYYDFLDQEYIINFDLFYHYINKYIPVLSLNTGQFINLITNPEKKETSNVNSSTLDVSLAEQIGLSQFGVLFSSCSSSSLPKNIIQIEEMIKLCESKNITPVFITTPLYHTLHSNFTEEFLDTFYSDVQSITSGYLYLDYSTDERFSTNNMYFGDTNHLNYDGSIYFTDILLSDIDDLIGLPQ